MTSTEAWFNRALCPRKPEGSLGRTAQDGHLDSHTVPDLCLRPDSSSSSYHNDSKTAIQTTTMIPTLSSSNTWSNTWLREQLTNQPGQSKRKEKRGINTQLSWQTVASVGPPKTHHQDRNQLITQSSLRNNTIPSFLRIQHLGIKWRTSPSNRALRN